MNFVAIKHVTFRYARRQPPVIDDFSCTLNKGEVVGILGASGSGKSSLLRLVAGLELPEKGSIMIDGMMMVNDGLYVDVENRGVGMVFQDYALFPHLNVVENIAFGLHKLKRAARKERVQEMLELVQLTDYAKRYPHELSGGQQQRVALARALAPKPSILLMDEPFSSLDASLKTSIRSELRQILRKAEMTCLLVSHDAADIEAICDRSIRIQKEMAEATA
ncbi:Sulfate/thiosulfate import ATP-binding protein CysA [Paenibacillus plantiphilus]|uniref:Sulfate/thiosulfate import ATP-binding protein CysA n=1 Tax=Paenibacillus plantiphilus TaxID=2905650 RepID=A0ABN8G7Q8_9BACL|nr:ABC transporter ATP-binding protein [Paenibacillus plantiphilus]CAH1197591.1 Sulfate/thiosulfate import ATP-binding protein CysA [Paenibacillus plantiphilus]